MPVNLEPSPAQSRKTQRRLTGPDVVFSVFIAGIKKPSHPLPVPSLPNTHVPLCSSAFLPKSLSPLLISINPLNVPFSFFSSPHCLSRASPAACCCCPAESYLHFARKRERFMCVCVLRGNEAERAREREILECVICF